MIIKLVGGAMIIAATGILGIAAANKYSLRPKDIRKFRSAVQMLETEIIFGCTPLPQALSNIAAKSEGALSRFFCNVADDLLTAASYSLEGAWGKALNILIQSSSLNASDQELIGDFGKVLGGSDREDQKKHFELLYIQLKQHEVIAEEERRKNEKMYRSLGFLSGIVIFIMLI